ncbi:hypothetical protein ACSBR1_029384 [Camellia fascicularis]
MAQENPPPPLDIDPLGDDDGVALVEKHKVEKVVERRAKRLPHPIPLTMILAAQPISRWPLTTGIPRRIS